jgi:hypothetical protein
LPEAIDLKTLKQMNIQLAASARKCILNFIFIEQSVRDQALDKLITMLATNKQWFLIEPMADETPESNLTKNIRRVWEGLFFSKFQSVD